METASSPSRPRAPHAPRAVLPDAYGTLFDVKSKPALAEQLFPPRTGLCLAVCWRDKQIEYTRLVSMSGTAHYRPFWEITRRPAPCRAAPGAGVGCRSRRAADEPVPPPQLPGEQGGAAGAGARGVPAGILSNGDPQMPAVAVKSAGLDGLLDPLLSVHETRRYKTDPAA